MEETIAVVASLAALLGTALGFLFNTWRFRSERQQWQRQFDTEAQRWRTEYDEARERWLTELMARQDEQRVRLLERRIERRFATYGPVLALLGKVRDYDSPDGNYFQQLKKQPEQLSEISAGLLEQLYGDAGLVMEMDTRNALVDAIQTAESFRLGRVSLDDVCESFFMARRCLRSDLQICDHDLVKGELEILHGKYRELLEERRSQLTKRTSDQGASSQLDTNQGAPNKAPAPDGWRRR